MILLTGATGVIGRALLRAPDGVRTAGALPGPESPAPRRAAGAGPDRARRSRRSALLPPRPAGRGHRHPPRGRRSAISPGPPSKSSTASATWRLVRAAERAGVRRFVFFSALGAYPTQRTRFFRAKALAERAVTESDAAPPDLRPLDRLPPGDPWVRLLRAPLAAARDGGVGFRARDLPAHLGRGRGRLRAGRAGRTGGDGRRFELAGPDTLSYDEIVRLVLRSAGRRRRLFHVPLPVVARRPAGAGARWWARASSPPGRRPS